MLSLKNVSNDFRWKNQKFSEPYKLAFNYNPEIVIQIPKIDIPYFYARKDTLEADKHYNVKELLEKKLRKRNIDISENSTVKLKIDKLLFKEYAESFTVRSINEGEFLEETTQDFFIFEITGSIVRGDSVIKQVTVKHEYNNEPRESYVFDGIVVMGGGGARADKMIENSINEFSYRIYEVLTKPEVPAEND